MGPPGSVVLRMELGRIRTKMICNLTQPERICLTYNDQVISRDRLISLGSTRMAKGESYVLLR